MAGKKQVSPVVVAVVIVVVLALIAVAYMTLGKKGGKGTEPEMTPDLQKQQMEMMQKNMPQGAMGGGMKGSGPSLPSGGGMGR